MTQRATMKQNIDNLGNGKISRLVGRIRSFSSSVNESDDSSRYSSRWSSTDDVSVSGSPPASKLGKSPPTFKTKAAATSCPQRTSPRSARRTSFEDPSEASRDLWNKAYDSLRDAPPTAQLVRTFEEILCQELPAHMKMGMRMTFKDYPAEKRTELMDTISAAGLAKRRGSGPKDEHDCAKWIIDTCKDSLMDIRDVYPATSVAWCGLSILTPLLLDSVIQKEVAVRTGMAHILGRIHWYMLLVMLTDSRAWLSEEEYNNRITDVKEELVRLYRKVLEFQMNMICGAARKWNAAARNLVDWRGIAEMVKYIEDLDNKFRDLAEKEVTSEVLKKLVCSDRDMEAVPLSWF